MSDGKVAQRAREYARELRERLATPTGEQAPGGATEDVAWAKSELPAFLSARTSPARPTPRSGELWMAFPKGPGLPTPVALLHAHPLLVVPMTREVWLADAEDPLVPPEQSPTGEWLAALLPGAATMEAALLRRPVGGLPAPLVTLLQRLVDGPPLQRRARGAVPVSTAESDDGAALPSHVTAWSSDDPGLESWLGGQPMEADDPRSEARQLHLAAVAWVAGEPVEQPAPAPRRSVLDRLHALLSQLRDSIDPSEGVTALGQLVLGWFPSAAIGASFVPRAAGLAGRRPPLEGAFRLGAVLIELSFELEPTRLRLTVIATRKGRGEPGVQVAVRTRGPGASGDLLKRTTDAEGLVAGLLLPIDEEWVHELAIEADGHRRVLDL